MQNEDITYQLHMYNILKKVGKEIIGPTTHTEWCKQTIKNSSTMQTS